MDLSDAKKLESALAHATALASEVVVDLQGTIYIDTAILGCLAVAGKAMRERGKQLKVLLSENSHPLYVISMVGFNGLMDIEVTTANSRSNEEPTRK